MRGPDRPLTAHGPIVTWLIVLMAVSLVVSAVSLVLALTSLQMGVDKATVKADANSTAQAVSAGKIAAIEESRQQALTDTCQELRKLILVATPKTRTARGRAFIVKAGLSDCRAYARRLSALPPDGGR